MSVRRDKVLEVLDEHHERGCPKGEQTMALCVPEAQPTCEEGTCGIRYVDPFATDSTDYYN